MTDTTTATAADNDVDGHADVSPTIEVYLSSLNEADRTTRTRLIEQAWAPDGAYSDPLQSCTGHQELVEMVDAIGQHFPGHSFRRTSGIDGHHGRHRFAWELAAEDGTVAVAGIDVAEIGDDGRLTRITGFFGDLPET